MNRRELLKVVKGKLRESSYNREDFLQHASQTADDLDNVLNLMFEHLRNWYSIYLPELNGEDRKAYLEIVEKYTKGDEKSIERLSKKAKKMLPKNKSIGAEANADDLDMMRKFAAELTEMYEFKEKLDKYRDIIVNDIAKNLVYLIGAPLATKLIVEAKGLKRLANMPASSIQVLGAEKALFMHLTRHTKPPKHGMIFLHSLMRGIKKSNRGKVARLIAAKISIAVKADAYTGKFLAPKLKEQLEKKVEELR